MSYKVFRNNQGKVDAINRTSDGATVPTWDATSPIAQEYQQWKQAHPDFDDADHEPDPVLTPAPTPDWAGFRTQMLTSSIYIRIMTANPANMVLNPTLVWLLGEIDTNPALLSDFKKAWDAIASNTIFVLGEINALNKIGKDTNMPFSLDMQGRMIING